MRSTKGIVLLIGLSLAMLVAVFWGCQPGDGPSDLFKDWDVLEIWSDTQSGQPDRVIADTLNTICARVGRVEGEDFIPLPTNQSVYFTIVADTMNASGGMGLDTLMSQYETNPSTPGEACLDVFVPSNALNLRVAVTVIGVTEVTKSRIFTTYQQGVQNLYLAVSQNTVTAGGGQVTIVAMLLNSFGEPIPDEMLCFTTSTARLGFLADSCRFTTTAGTCTTRYVVGNVSGVDTVYVQASGGSRAFQQIIINAAPAYAGNVTLEPNHVFRCGTDLNDRTQIRANLFDIFGNSARNGTKVTFEIDEFTHRDSCSSSDTSACSKCPRLYPLGADNLHSDTVSVVNGVATISMRAGSLPGVARLKIRVHDTGGLVLWSPVVNISSGQPHYVSLSARVPGDMVWQAGDPNQNFFSAPIDNNMWGACTQDSMPLEIMAIVSDEFHNPIPGASVWFTTSSGVVGGWPGSPLVALTTDTNGIATSYWFSSDRRELDSCLVKIKSFCENISISDSMFFYLRYEGGEICCRPCQNVSIRSVSAVPDTVNGNGTDSITVVAHLGYGDLPLTNYPVNFRTYRGWISDESAITGTDGKAYTHYYAVNAVGSTFADSVRAIAGTSCDTGFAKVYARPAAISLTVTLISDNYNPNVGGQTVNLTGLIRDASGMPMRIPLPISWYATDSAGSPLSGLGSFSRNTTYSDTLGNFSNSFTTGSYGGELILNAVIASVETAHVTLNVLPAFITLTADDVNPAVGGDIVHLSGIIRNSMGAPITTPTIINWNALLFDGTTAGTTYGRFDSLSLSSDAYGQFTGVYITNTAVGSVNIIASAEGIGADTATLIIGAGTPASIDMRLSQSIDTVGSLTPDTIYGQIVDAFGNPVRYTGVVRLFIAYSVLGDSCYPCSYGDITPRTVIADSLGRFSARFSPGVAAGSFYIFARADSAYGFAPMSLVPQIARASSVWVNTNRLRTCGNPPYQTTINCKVVDQYNNNVADGTPLMFVIDTFTYMEACTTWADSCLSSCPRLIPWSLDLGYMASDTVYTLSGIATATLKSGNRSGTVRLASYVLDGSSEVSYSEAINISSGNVGQVSIAAMKRVITTSCDELCAFCQWGGTWYSGNPTWGGYAPQLNRWRGWVEDGDTCNGLWLKVRVAMSDSFGNPIPGITVHFSCDEGVIGGAPGPGWDTLETSLTDSFGFAYTYWYAADPRTDGKVWLRALSADRSIGDSLWFYLTDSLGVPPYDTVNLELVSIWPDTVFGDGISTSQLLVRVSRNGNPVPNYPVYFNADFGMIDDVIITDSIGYGMATYYSAINESVGAILIDELRMIAGDDTLTRNVYLYPVDPILRYVSMIRSGVSPNNIIAIGDSLVLSGIVYDGRGYPVRLPVPVYFMLKMDGEPVPYNVGIITPSYVYTGHTSETSGRFSAVIRTGTRAAEFWVVMMAVAGGDTAWDSLMIGSYGDVVNRVTVTPERTYLDADGRSSMEVVVRVTDMYGNPVPNKNVTLSTSLGTLIPTSASTDYDGEVRAQLVAGMETGVALVDATCEGIRGFANVEFRTATVHFMILSANPNRIVADGASTAVIKALALDQYGQPVADGTMIAFRCLDESHSRIGIIDSIDITASGIAEVTLRSETRTGRAWVYATAMDYDTPISSTESLLVEFIAGDPYTLILSSDVDTIPADGASLVNIEARVFDEYGNPMGRSREVEFTTTGGTLLLPRTFTNDSGIVRTMLQSSRTMGPVQITATSGDAENTYLIYFSPVVAHSITVVADSTTMQADGRSATIIHAIPFDEFGAAVPDGTPVRFTTSLGVLIPGYAYTTEGEAQVTLRSPLTPGVANITASTSTTVADTTFVTFVPGKPYSIEMTADPNAIFANGADVSLVTGNIFDRGGNAVSAGHRVKIQCTLGSVDTIAYTNASGTFTANFRAGMIPGTALVIATSDSAAGQANIDLLPTNVGEVAVWVDTTRAPADGMTQVAINGIVNNDVGYPIADGTPVRLSLRCEDTTGDCSNFGRIIPLTVPTDSGSFTAAYTTGTRTGRVWIYATVDTFVDSAFIDIMPGGPDSIAIVINPTMLPADNFSTATITATLFDAYGNRVGSGHTVNFATTEGTITPNTRTTPATGQVTTTIHAGRNTGIAYVTVTSGSAFGIDTLVLTATNAGLVLLTVEPIEIIADGMSSAIVRADVVDTSGNPISNGAPVAFTQVLDSGATALGILMPNIAFTRDGQAAISFRSRKTIGVANVRGCADLAHCDEVDIRLIAGLADSIYLEAADSSLPADGASFSELFATAFDRNGNRVERGRMMEFASTKGSVEPSSSPTSSAGEAGALLIAPTEPGRAWVTATLEDAYAILPVEFGMAPPIFLSINANPRRLIADGLATSTITARLITAVGEPVLDGTLISFHAVDSTGARLGDIDTLALTSGGTATVTLTAPTTIGTAWISATWIGESDTLSDTVTVQFTPGPVAEVRLFVEPDTLYANDTLAANVKIVVSDIYGNLVAPGTTVNVSVDNGSIYPTTSYTGDTIRCRYYPGSSAGRALITVNAGGIVGSEIVELLAQTIATMFIYSDSTTITANGSSITKIHVIAQDALGRPVADNSPVFFSTTAGILIPAVGYTHSGEAVVDLRASTTAPDTAVIVATAGTIGDTAQVVFRAGPPALIQLMPNEELLYADGSYTTTIRAFVHDAYGNWVPEGTPLTFTTSLGTIDSFTATRRLGTDTTGYAQVRFRSGIVPGTALVSASSLPSAAMGTAVINLVPTNVGDIYVSIDSSRITANATSHARIFGRVVNTVGLPITDGTPVALRLHCSDTLGCFEYGDVIPSTVLTDSGYFEGSFNAGIRTGRVWIVASVDSFADSVFVDLTAGDPGYMTLTVTPEIIPADSFTTANIRGTIYDRFGNVVGSGVAVELTTTLGQILVPSTTTNMFGDFTATLRSGRTAGVARVRAVAEDAIGEDTIVFSRTDVANVFLSIDSTQLVANGINRTFVHALVQDSLGNPISNGTPVLFRLMIDSLAPDTLGLLIPTIGFTDTGVARVSFRSSTHTGTARLRACAAETICSYNTVNLIAGPPESIYVVAADSLLPADGVSITTITVSVFDRYGNPVKSGTAVNVNTTLGSLVPSTIYTNSLGTAVLMLTAASTPGLAWITANAEEAYATTTVNFGMTPPVMLSIHANPRRIIADGEATTTITARMINAVGAPVVDGTMVFFGSIDSTGAMFGDLDTIATTRTGEASVTLTSAENVGQARVYAVWRGETDTLSDTITVTFIPGEASQVSVIIEPDTLYANDTLSAEVRVLVTDANDNMILPGSVVSLTVENGELFPTISYTGRDTIRSRYYPGSLAGRSIVTAECNGIVGSAIVELLSQRAASISVFADSASLIADGSATTQIHAVALDSSGRPIADNSPIFFRTSKGILIPAVSYTTSGEAITVLRAPTHAPDTAWVIARAGAVIDSVPVVLRAGAPALVNLRADSTTLYANGRDRSAVHAYVRDAHGNWVREGTPVIFRTTLGVIDSFTATSAIGMAETTGYSHTNFTSGIAPGSALITATADLAMGTTVINLIPSDVGNIYVSVGTTQLVADGTNTTIVSGRVTNTSGFPITDGTPVSVEIHCSDTLGCFEYGDVLPSIVLTDSGYYNATFTAGIRTGRVWIVASVDTFIDSAFIDLIAGPPGYMEISVSPMAIFADSFATANVFTRTFDRFGNVVGSGNDVTFTSTLGAFLIPNTTTNIRGEATAVLRSGRTPGVARIRAICGSAIAEDTIVFTSTEARNILLTIDSTSITANGLNTAIVRAIVSDSIGNPVSNGTAVIFAQIVDTAAGEDTLGRLVPTIGFTDSGIAMVHFRAGKQIGLATIEGCIGGACSRADVELVAGAPDSIYFAAADTALPADGVSITLLDIAVFDRYGNPAKSGTVVNLATTLGSITPSSIATDNRGRAIAMFQAASEPGLAWLTASSGEAYATEIINLGLTPPVYLSIRANPRRVIADGLSTATVTARMINSVGAPVVDGTMMFVHSRDSLGNDFGDMDTIATTRSGEVSLELLSPLTVGRAWVSATYYGADTLTDTVIVNFIPGPPSAIRMFVDPDTLYANDTLSAEVKIVVVDLNGNMVEPGTAVDVSVDNGTIFPSTSYTGDTIRCRYYPGSSAGRALITASSGSIVGSAIVELMSQSVARMFIYADSTSMTANGTNTTRVHVIAQDASLNPVADNTPIYFGTSAGIIIPGVGYTASGEAVVTLRAGTHAPDTAEVIAFAGAVSETVNVALVAGAPSIIRLAPDTTILFANGEDTTGIEVTVHDAHGNWVREGTPLTFTSSLGRVDSFTVTRDIGGDTTGWARVKFRSGIVPGSALITGNSGTAMGTAVLNLIPSNVGDLYVSVDSVRITANSRNISRVSGRVTNTSGYPITDGTPVTLAIHCTDTLGCYDYGDVVPVTVLTDSGYFNATFTSGIRTGRIWIIASVGAVTDSAFIDLISGPPGYMNVVTTPSIISADSFSTANITAYIFDIFGNPVSSGNAVSFSTTLGNILVPNTTTNLRGEAMATIRSGRNVGVGRIRVTAGSAIGEDTIVFVPTDVRNVILTIDSTRMVANGMSTTRVNASVLDSLGNPISNGTPVSFSIVGDTLGYLVPIIGFTSGGSASVSFRSGTQIGEAVLRACVDTAHCDDREVELVAGIADSIDIVPSRYTMPADGVSITTIALTVYDRYGNRVQSGTEIDVTTTLGSLTPSSVRTNSSGQATVMLTSASTPGLAWVTAQSGDAFATDTVSFGMTPPIYLAVRANPRRIAADGVATSTVTARLINETGESVLDGTMVHFRSIDTLGVTFGEIDSIATTTSGEATVTLLSATRMGDATVIATWFSGADTLADTVIVTFTPGTPTFVRVVATPETLYANDTLTAHVAITVTDFFGNMVLPGSAVNIEVDNGDIFPATAYTSEDTIIADYYPGSVAGRAVITARSGSIVGTDIVTLLSQSIRTLTIYADSAFLLANGLNQTQVNITAIDSLGRPIADNTPIYLTSTSGLVFPGVVYTVSGNATATLRAGTQAPETCWVIATAGAVADSAHVIFKSGPPAMVTVLPDTNMLFANGDDTTLVRVYIRDVQNNWVAEGKTVNFAVNPPTMGTISSFDVTHAVGETTGYASAIFRASISAGTAIITANCEGATGITRIALNPTNVGTVEIFATPDLITADGRSVSAITGMVRNTLGYPITDGTQVLLGVRPDSLGSISPSTVYTDSGAFAATFTAGTNTDSVYVWADVAGVRDSLIIEMTPGEPHHMVLTPNPTSIPADSHTVDTIDVQVFDRFGNSVGGGVEVTFTTTLGEVFPLSNETDLAGETYFFLRSGYQLGTARVVARAGSARGEATVNFYPRNASTILLTASPNSMAADGYSTSTLVASVYDSTFRPVADGTPVRFVLSDTAYGVVVPQIAYTTSGNAQATFRSAVHKGTVGVRAEVSPTVYDELSLVLEAGPAAICSLFVVDDTLSANSIDETAVLLRVYDEWGNPVDAGLDVTFSATLGTIVFTNLMTNERGEATTVLRAGNVPGICQVVGRCGSSIDVEPVVFLRSRINSILLSAAPTELIADGISNSVITAQAFDASGSPVTDYTPIYFWSRPESLGTVVSPKTTLGGSAVTTFNVETAVGNGWVWVYAGDDTNGAATYTDSLRIRIKPGTASFVSIWADSTDTAGIHPDSLYANNSDGIWIFARVFDAYGNRVQGGQSVAFATTIGEFTPITTMTDTSGTARAFLRSSLEVGSATITATAGSAMGFKNIRMARTPVVTVLLDADSTRLRTDGDFRATLTALALGPGGNPVSDNTTIYFAAENNWLNLVPASRFTTDGEASTMVIPDTSAHTQVRVYAWAAGSDSASLIFRVDPGAPSRMTVAPAPSDSVQIAADGASSVEVHVYVYDQFSNPVRAGTIVRFETTLGTITPSNFTDLSGHCSALLTAGTVTGNAVISIHVGDIIGFTQIKLTQLLADDIVLTITPIQLTADGVSTATVTARAYDSGFPVSDGTMIRFFHDTTVASYSGGRIDPHTAYTSGGAVTVTLTAPYLKGSDRIVAQANGSVLVADTFQVRYVPGLPAVIEFIDTYFTATDTFRLDNFTADGRHFPVSVRVTDAYGNPVTVGTSLDFTTTIGNIETPAVVHDTNGIAVTYISSRETGPGVITARVGSTVSSAPCYFREVQGNWMRVTVNPQRITANGVATALIKATVMDTSTGVYVPVSDGVAIQFSNLGPASGLLSSSISFTVGGQAEVTLTAGTISGQASIAVMGPIAGTDTLSDTVTVTFDAGDPAIVSFMSFPESLSANGADTGGVWVRVTDQFGNGVRSGIPVTFSTTLGTFSGSSVTRNIGTSADSTGYAYSIITSSASPGIATLSASAGSGAVGYATVFMQALTADSLALRVNPRSVVADGVSPSTVTAIVFDTTGVPLPVPVSDGTIVHFFASRGIVTPVIAYTTSGFATAQYLPPVTLLPDTVLIYAYAGATTVSDIDTIILMPGDPSIVTLSADTNILIANGLTSDTVRATVMDQYGNNVGAGKLVTFTTTLGVIAGTAYTNAAGIAKTVLTTERVAGWANVSATCGTATSNMLIQFVPEAVGGVVVSVNPIRIVADGISTATVRIAVRDTAGNPIADGTPVFLSLANNLGFIDPALVVTTAGQATATLTSFVGLGFDTIYADAGIIGFALVEFIAGDPANVVVYTDTVGSTTVPALRSDGIETTMVFAVVTDAVGHRVREGVAVNFSTNPATGMGTVWPVGITNASGVAYSVYTAGTMPGLVSIEATAISASGTGIIQLQPSNLHTCNLYVSEHYVLADGVSRIRVTAMVFDVLDLPAPDGTGVRFTTTPSSVPASFYPGYKQTTAGIAEVELIAPTEVGVCTVFAYVDTGGGYATSIISNRQVVYFEGGDPRIIVFNKSLVNLLADGTSVDSTCTLTVLDEYGNYVPGATVNLSIDMGGVTPAIIVTDSLGRGKFTIVSPRHAGTGLVTAVSGSASGYLLTRYNATPVGSIALYATPNSLPANGTSESRIRAVVLDPGGRPVSDGMSVFFRTTRGYITPFDTTVNGQSFATLTAIDTAAMVTVWARVGNDSTSVNVTFTAGDPDTIYVEFIPDTSSVGSPLLGKVTGSVKDALGNPVGMGTLLHLSLSDYEKGTLGDTVLTTGVGAVGDSFVTTFTSGTKAGIVWVTATAGAAAGTDFLLLKPQIAHTESIDVNRNQIYVKGSGSIDQAVLTAFFFDRYGNPVADSTKVVYQITLYPGGADANRRPSMEPPHPTLGQLFSDTVYTLNGQARVTLRAGKASGVAVVRATEVSTGVTSEAPRITIASGLPYHISVSRTDCNVPGWLVDGLTNTILVIVSDSMTNPVPNAAVYFTCDEGVVTGSAVTDSFGQATATWFSSNPRGVSGVAGSGDVFINASTRGDLSASCDGTPGWVCDSVMFFNSGPAIDMLFSPETSSTFADSNSYTVFTMYLNDVNDNPVADGTRITLSTSYGTVPDSVTTTGECSSSWGRFRYYGSPTRRDDHCSDMLAQDVGISAWADWSSSSAVVHLEHNFCDNTRSSIRMPSSIGSGGSFYASVNVRDQWSNPICGESVHILVTGGTVVGSATVATDNSGAALFTIQAAALDSGVTSGTVYVSAAFSACAVSGTVSISSSRLVSPRFGTDGELPSSSPLFVPYEVPESIIPTLRKPESSGTARIFEPSE